MDPMAYVYIYIPRWCNDMLSRNQSCCSRVWIAYRPPYSRIDHWRSAWDPLCIDGFPQNFDTISFIEIQSFRVLDRMVFPEETEVLLLFSDSKQQLHSRLGVTMRDIHILVRPPGTANENWTYFDKKAFGPGGERGNVAKVAGLWFSRFFRVSHLINWIWVVKICGPEEFCCSCVNNWSYQLVAQ